MVTGIKSALYLKIIPSSLEKKLDGFFVTNFIY